MKATDFAEYSKSALAGAVKLSQRKQLTDAKGHTWHDWVQAQPAGKKLSDPRRYSEQQLASFLASLSSQKPDPRAPDAPLVKPQKLLKRYLPWLTARIELERGAAAGFSTSTAGGKKGGAAAAAADVKQARKADAVWQLMQRTRQHPRFHQWYSFDSFEKGWVVTGRSAAQEGEDGAAADASAAALPTSWRLLGLDCEMCVTADSDKELLQVALVDQDSNILMQELVRPGADVLDYRTQLTGITAADLEGVTLTRKAAAKRLAKLLTPETVLVGHGLHHDLRALQLDHPWVIDTSLIYTFKGLSNLVPSLALLSEQLLGKPIRGRDPSTPFTSSQQQQQLHDSKEDASVALALVLQELQRGTPPPPLDPPEVKVDKAELAKLCVHRLPHVDAGSKKGSSNGSSSSSTLQQQAAAVKEALAAACSEAGAEAEAAAVQAAAVEEPPDNLKRLLYLAFEHAGVANKVFAALPGKMFTDSRGRHSKEHAVPGSKRPVIVRKMACHNGLEFGKDKPADRGAAKSKGKAAAAGKKRRHTSQQQPQQDAGVKSSISSQAPQQAAQDTSSQQQPAEEKQGKKDKAHKHKAKKQKKA